MKRNTTAKYKILRDELLRAIRDGEFHAGQRLPAERELAAKFKVTHMTVRQAVTELVDFELLERRSRMGIFVREHSREKLSTTTLNIICSVADSSITSRFINLCRKYAEQRGWRTRITRSHLGYEAPLIRVIRSGEPSFVFLDLPGLTAEMRDAMIDSQGRAIMLGNKFDHLGVSSVMADDSASVEIAVDHLRAAGHEKIGLAILRPQHPVVQVQVAAWKSCFPDEPEDVMQSRHINVDLHEFEDATEFGYRAFAEYLKRDDADVTAFICTNDMMAVGAVYALREAGRRIPDDMSFMCTLDSPLLEYLDCGITNIDINMEAHVAAGVQMLNEALTSDKPHVARLSLVQPHLVQRNSVAPPRH